MEQLSLVFKFIFSQKSKIALMFLSALIFVVVLFPFGDLTDLISTKVAELSHNQLLLQFENLKLGIFPAPEIHLDNVAVDVARMPTIKADEISVTPSPSIIWSKTPTGSMHARGLFRGDVEVSIESGPKSDSGTARQRINLKADKVSLQEIRELARLPVALKGQLSMQSTALADLAFTEQPDMDVTLTVDKFELPPGQVQTPGGPIALPELKLSSVVLKGKLSQGRFNIEEGIVGGGADDLHGTVKGGIGLQIQNQGGISPVLGAYNFEVNMTAKKNFQDRAALFLIFLDQQKTMNADGSAQYKFRISANNTYGPPNISALR